MKNFLICLSLLLLTACIPVDDFGGYWEKGFGDSKMAGKWRKYSGTDKAEVLVTAKHGWVQIDSLDPKERKAKDYAPVRVRSLQAGRYYFLMARTKDGRKKESLNLVRYAINKKGDTLVEYNLSDNQMNAFLKKHYSKAKNIGMKACKGACLFSPLKIGTLDAETVKILANIPDKRQYWQKSDTWRKVN